MNSFRARKIRREVFEFCNLVGATDERITWRLYRIAKRYWTREKKLPVMTAKHFQDGVVIYFNGTAVAGLRRAA